jgi:hypothetical protein
MGTVEHIQQSPGQAFGIFDLRSYSIDSASNSDMAIGKTVMLMLRFYSRKLQTRSYILESLIGERKRIKGFPSPMPVQAVIDVIQTLQTAPKSRPSAACE